MIILIMIMKEGIGTMEKINYQKKLLELIANLNNKPSLLLHSCCGPCSTAVIDFLKSYFNITIFYYNPNIEPFDEYLKRKNEQIRLLAELKKEDPTISISFLDCDYDNVSFKEIAKNLEQEKEGGARCHKCYYLRLLTTGKKAQELNFDYFGTTLTVSPHKNSQIINQIGEKIAQDLNISYLYGDFKKNNGYLKSIELSHTYNLYRQDYCGCLYGKELQHDQN